MSYLLDKKIKRNNFFKITLGIVILVALFYFRAAIFRGFSKITGEIFRPILIAGNNIGGKIGDLRAYFTSKNSLYLENENLKSQIEESAADRANYNSIVAENSNLKEILGRLPAQTGKNSKTNMVLAAILAKPNRSPYDTLLIDAGIEQGIKTGDVVFAIGNIPVGRVDSVYENSAKVILFSNPGEKTQAVISSGQAGGNVFMELVGRGGGNFEMVLPRNLILQKGDQVAMAGLNTYILAIVDTVISDPRDPFTKALLVSPVNIQELKFVQVEI